MPSIDLDAAFAALADPTRRAIVGRLARGEASVAELSEPFGMTQPAISQHLKVLEAAGLVTSRVDGSRRPRRLRPEGLASVDRWLSSLQHTLERNYARLDDVLAGLEPVHPRRNGAPR
jgi:DNA-binding transcriptional ArsR family regulator